jgi:hypothetical protein
MFSNTNTSTIQQQHNNTIATTTTTNNAPNNTLLNNNNTTTHYHHHLTQINSHLIQILSVTSTPSTSSTNNNNNSNPDHIQHLLKQLNHEKRYNSYQYGIVDQHHPLIQTIIHLHQILVLYKSNNDELVDQIIFTMAKLLMVCDYDLGKAVLRLGILNSTHNNTLTIIHNRLSNGQYNGIFLLHAIGRAIRMCNLTEREHIYNQLNQQPYSLFDLIIGSKSISTFSYQAKYSLLATIQFFIGGNRMYFDDNYNMGDSITPPISLYILNDFVRNGLLALILQSKLPLLAFLPSGDYDEDYIKATTSDDGNVDEDEFFEHYDWYYKNDVDPHELGEFPLCTAMFLYRLVSGLFDSSIPHNNNDDTMISFHWLVKVGNVAQLFTHLLDWKSKITEWHGPEISKFQVLNSLIVMSFTRMIQGLGGVEIIDALDFASSIVAKDVDDEVMNLIQQHYDWCDVLEYDGETSASDDEIDPEDDGEAIFANPEPLIVKLDRTWQVMLHEYESDEMYSNRDSIYIRRVGHAILFLLKFCKAAKSKAGLLASKVGKSASKIS